MGRTVDRYEASRSFLHCAANTRFHAQPIQNPKTFEIFKSYVLATTSVGTKRSLVNCASKSTPDHWGWPVRRYLLGRYERSVSANVEQQPPEKIPSLLSATSTNLAHFLTVTDSRPLERHFFPTYMNDRSRISPLEYIVARPGLRASAFV